MRNVVCAIALTLLLISCSPTIGKVFDVGNYTIDTGAYTPAYNAGVSKGVLSWNWDNKEMTIVSIYSVPSNLVREGLKNMTADELKNYSVRLYAWSIIEMLEGINTMDIEVERKLANRTPYILVNRPYPGILTAPPDQPTTKIYLGAIDEANYISLISTESEEMVGMILRELKAYPKELAGAARLTAIQRTLNA